MSKVGNDFSIFPLIIFIFSKQMVFIIHMNGIWIYHDQAMAIMQKMRMIVYFSCNYFHFFRIENLGLKKLDMILTQPNNAN